MSPNDTIQNMLMMYPSLFTNRIQCLDHLLLTNGNGYKWVAGELIDYDDEGKSTYADAVKKNFIDRYHKFMRDHLEDIIAYAIECSDGSVDELTADIMRYVDSCIEKIYNTMQQITPDKIESAINDMESDPGELYPLCKYSDIMNIPDDITDEWKSAVKDFYIYLTTSDHPKVVAYRNNPNNKKFIDKIETSKFM